ncbi:MAG: hypothetical protein ACHQIG_10725 [Acidimicrobiia bacterium]
MNLVGHVAVATRQHGHPSPELLVGAMLPDLGSIARVRLLPAAELARGEPARDLAVGLALHHASDAAFHGSRWFHDHNRALRDSLLDAGVDRGAARACAHAGLEMLLDGDLVTDPTVADATGTALEALTVHGPTREAVAVLVAPAHRASWIERLDRIARSLDPRAYTSASNVAVRLHRMTSGRARIELRAEHVPGVAGVLEAYRPVVVLEGARVVEDVLAAITGDARSTRSRGALV